MKKITKKGYSFIFLPDACKACNGNCCTGESGYVWVKKEEIQKISTFLKMNKCHTIKNFTRKINYKVSLIEIKRQNSYDCIFFDIKKKTCSIYRVRPAQCKAFPFWSYVLENIESSIKECPGIELIPVQ